MIGIKKPICCKLSDQTLFDIAWFLKLDQRKDCGFLFDHYGNVLNKTIKLQLVSAIRSSGYHYVIEKPTLRLFTR